MVVPGNGKLELIYTPEGGQAQRMTVLTSKMVVDAPWPCTILMKYAILLTIPKFYVKDRVVYW